MANYTTNLKLEKPLETEAYDIKVFNRNMDKIDAEMVEKLDKIKKATGDEVATGTDNDKYITPFALKNVISKVGTIFRNNFKVSNQLEENAIIAISKNYKVGNSSLKVWYEGCLLEKNIHYSEIGEIGTISNQIQLIDWGSTIKRGKMFQFEIREEGISNE